MKSFILKIIAIVLAWLVGFAVACGAEHPAVVRIVATGCNGSMCERSYGSGTLVDVDGEQGVIVTCSHLFRDRPSSITVRFSDGRQYQARLVGTDTTWDLAALVIAKPTVSPIPIAADFPKPGDRLAAGGYGRDGRLAWQSGQAIGYARPQSSNRHEWLKLSGAARDGDSGGPVINERGELVAVLWGTNSRVIHGSYCGRVRKFLACCFPRFRARPPRPECPPPPPPVCGPEQPVQPSDCITQEQFAVLVAQVVALEITVGKLVSIAPPIAEDGLPGPPGLQGDQGPQGPPGEQGPPGSTAEIDLDKLVDLVIARMPPITLVSEDESRIYWEREVRPGDRVPLPGFETHHVDGITGKLKRAERINLADVLTIIETPHSSLHKDK